MARTALASAPPAAIMISALVNGAAGVVVMTHERPFVVMGFTVVRGKIVEIDCFLDPERLARLDLAGLDGGPESLIESRRATRSAAAALGVRMHSGQKMTNPNQPIAAAQMLIRRPVRVVFEAFVDPALTSRFWFSRGSGRLEAGKSVRWDWEMYGVGTTVDVKAIEPDKRILVEWDGPEDPSPVEWTFVKIRNWGFSGDTDEVVAKALDSTGGCYLVLAGAKFFLEQASSQTWSLIGRRMPSPEAGRRRERPASTDEGDRVAVDVWR